MCDDQDRQDADAEFYLANKIKRCRKCGQELHYKEKFYYTDNICNACKGLPSFDISEPSVVPQTAAKSGHEQLAERISRLAQMGSTISHDAEPNIPAPQPEPRPVVESATRKPEKYPATVSDDRITELMAQYDDDEFVDVTQEELISLLWEIRYYRNT